jgi:hypothetical protein
MGEYLFGAGPGWLPKEADTIARKYGAWLVNFTGPQCKCGSGCRRRACKKNRRHWFATANAGLPYNQNTCDRVLQEVNEIGVINVEMNLHVIAHHKNGLFEEHKGTRSEIDTWMEERAVRSLSATVTTEAGLTVGKKSYGRETIVWGKII